MVLAKHQKFVKKKQTDVTSTLPAPLVASSALPTPLSQEEKPRISVVTSGFCLRTSKPEDFDIPSPLQVKHCTYFVL